MKPGAVEELAIECLVHDLNNVFQAILEAADVLSGDERWAALARAIQGNVDRGRRIVEGLSESGGAVDIGQALNDAVESTRGYLHATQGASVRFVQQVAPGLRVGGTAAAWERVFVNLFLNAAQAMPAGGAVEVRAGRAGAYVEVSVADDGCGIPAEILPEIFKPHFSTKSARAGLGLHIVDSIVRRNGGAVSAANRPGRRGAEFTLTLPAV